MVDLGADAGFQHSLLRLFPCPCGLLLLMVAVAGWRVLRSEVVAQEGRRVTRYGACASAFQRVGGIRSDLVCAGGDGSSHVITLICLRCRSNARFPRHGVRARYRLDLEAVK